ncbi:MAG: START domain-containing protein [Saprospiraceae bacterium]
MHKPIPALLLSCSLFALVFSSSPLCGQIPNPDGSGWIFKKEKSGIKVYYRKTSDIHEMKLATTLEASLSGVAQMLDEVPYFTKWGYKISEARLVKRISPSEMIYYARVDFPWPLNDRDLVLHTKLVQDPENRIITATSTAEPIHVPEVDGIIRMKKVHTRWTVRPGASKHLELEYYLYSDPGGSLPNWVINLALDMGPRETIKRMREMLKEPRYHNVKLAHIKE